MTNDQQKALVFLDQFLDDVLQGGIPSVSLNGYAGVGKTWLVAHWVARALEKAPGLRIVITAPTNKAVDVLRAKCGHLNVDFRTLDSFLGFKVKRDDDWKMKRSRNTKATDKDHVDILVVDEGSMVKDEYFQEVRHMSVPVVYVGDPAQLQPIGEECSPALSQERSIRMVEPTRQAADSPIHKLADFLRHKVEDGGNFSLHDLRSLTTGDKRVTFTSLRNVHNWADAALDKGMDCRILAFTNACVNEHNAIMHRRRYPHNPLFGEGELALVNEAFEYDDETLLCNGELLRVVSCQEVEPICDVRTFEVQAQKLRSNLQVDGETFDEVLTLHVALDAEHALRVHRDLTNRIYEARREGRMRESDELLEQRRPLNKLAPLRHSYSNTIHKSQGSTYDIAICDFPDIYRSKEMRARLFYVGVTRPSEFLVMAYSGG